MPPRQSSSTDGPMTRKTKFSIQWASNPGLTNKLVSWLHVHPGDFSILFIDTSGKKAKELPDDQKPSGASENSILTIVARHIFEDNVIYGDLYTEHPQKFTDSLDSHLRNLKSKYCTKKDWLRGTGHSVDPLGPDGHTTLMAQSLAAFPHFREFDELWHKLLLYNPVIFTSQPGVGHGDVLAGGPRGKTHNLKNKQTNSRSASVRL
ncbi:hypothetical protein BV22DRAFT_1135672 [Leucogyrophana mollusca]|uniref:Uncharacterized protein n=1 Tax=Leucogyrophana mollusca TaxID=85980 RepID=A0ACB8AV46_9AGAM|nr:hypothetical protein BV22DRAFT_1135672 [Leucogyrophana mollusca]